MDVLRIILFQVTDSKDIRSIELVCKQWRDLSRQRLYISSSRSSDFNLLLRYPRLIECDVPLDFPHYHEQTIKKKLSTMQLLSLQLKVFGENQLSFIDRLFGLTVVSKCQVKLKLRDSIIIHLQGRVMVINGSYSPLAVDVLSSFVRATKGKAMITTTSPGLQDEVYRLIPQKW